MSNPLADRHVGTIEPLPLAKRLRLKATKHKPKALGVEVPIHPLIPTRKVSVRLIGANSGDSYLADCSIHERGRRQKVVRVLVDPLAITEPVQVWVGIAHPDGTVTRKDGTIVKSDPPRTIRSR